MQENLHFHHQLDSQEAEILKTRQELLEVKSMQIDAFLAKDNAKEELAHQEDIVFRYDIV